MDDIEPWVASASTWIIRQARRYAPEVDGAGNDEPALLDTFDGHVEAVLAHFNPPVERRQTAGLVFANLYSAARKPEDDEEGWRVPSALLAAFLAAEAQFRGPLRLNTRQNALLAEEFEDLAAQLSALALPAHAARAYRRAAALYRIIEDNDAQDRCGLALSRARTRSLPRGGRKLLGQFSDVLCGYGYRPFRLLGWVGVQLVAFAVLGLALAGTPTATEAIYMAATCFLNPLGPGDTDHLHAAARPLFAIESWAGTVSMSVFFALLVRKWFRL
ncbi:hypothetical protein KO481_30240 [Nocardia sp. NEAU-G5]|uniref:Uncharacterized protein n=1 Tax=Nocardia albiluteola TaxID=2842303 RepID=A0ABS6B648_9NOCA|nr:hypothetical protein [Nocardia albiluteola]MBU3065792.1 hypothetical protein [Nocardia albiluteola]